MSADRHRGGEVGPDGGLDGRVDVVLVVEEDRELLDRLRGHLGELGLRLAQLLDEGLGGVQTAGDDLLGRRLGAALDEGPGLLGGLGLDHHDRDVTGLGDPPATTMSKTASSSWLWVGNATHWPSIRATRTPPTGPENGRPESWVDSDAALIASTSYGVGVERHHGDDDLDLVAQTLLEGRAQRPVDEAAGEDRVLAGPALGPEEGAGDLARGVHPLLDVDRQGEEVEVVLRVLAGRGGRQQHRVVVEVGRHGTGGLPGEQPGLELDGALAELAVVEDGLDGRDHGSD